MIPKRARQLFTISVGAIGAFILIFSDTPTFIWIGCGLVILAMVPNVLAFLRPEIDGYLNFRRERQKQKED